jgi:hypothetical protein
MGRIAVFFGLLVLLCLPQVSKAQIPYVLGIDSIAALPDTIIDGEEYTFFVEMTNASPLAFQGDSGSVNLMLQFNGSDSIAADSTKLLSPFVGSAGNATLLEVRHRFSSGGGSGLSIGINVVVVWPRINDGINPPQEILQPPYSRNIFLLEPNGIEERRSLGGFTAFPNPSAGLFELKVENQKRVEQVNLLDLSGRILQSWNSRSSVMYEVERGLKGNYLLEVRFEDGQKGHQLLILR